MLSIVGIVWAPLLINQNHIEWSFICSKHQKRTRTKYKNLPVMDSFIQLMWLEVVLGSVLNQNICAFEWALQRCDNWKHSTTKKFLTQISFYSAKQFGDEIKSRPIKMQRRNIGTWKHARCRSIDYKIGAQHCTFQRFHCFQLNSIPFVLQSWITIEEEWKLK